MGRIPEGQGSQRPVKFILPNPLELTKRFLERRPELKGLIDLGRIERQDYGLIFVLEKAGKERFWYKDDLTGEWYMGPRPPVDEAALRSIPRGPELPPGTSVTSNPFLAEFAHPGDPETALVELIERRFNPEYMQTLQHVKWNKMGVTDPRAYEVYEELGFHGAKEFIRRNLLVLDPRKVETALLIHEAQFGHLVPWAGRLRTVPIGVGGERRTVPPELLPKAMEHLEREVLGRLELPADPARLARELAWAHVEFESIHPFRDGNGRTGRLLVDFQARRARLKPSKAISELLWRESTGRNEYFDAIAAYRAGHKTQLEEIFRRWLEG